MKYVLDYDKWRCGSNYKQNECGLGSKRTVFHNKSEESHNMCCLGQFAKQSGVDLCGIDFPEPVELACYLNNAYDPNFVSVDYDDYSFYNTQAANDLMGINDCPFTTIKEKVEQIKKTMNRAGLEIEFVNFPEGIL